MSGLYGGTPGELDSNNQPIKTSSAGLGFRTSKRSFLPTESTSYTEDRSVDLNEYDFKVFPGEDPNEIAAQNQSVLNRVLKTPARLGVKVLSEMAKTPGYIAGSVIGAGSAMINGDASEFSAWIDNSWVKSISAMDEKVKNDLFKIYTPKAVKEGNLWDNITSASFWATEGVDGAGFFLASMLQGGMVNGLGLGSRVASNFGKTAQFARNVDMGAATAMSTVYEAASEAQGLVSNLKDQMIPKIGKEVNPDTGQLWTREEVDQSIGKAGAGTFLTNMALLVGPNFLMNKALLGRFSTSKNLINRTVNAEGKLLDDITPLTGRQKAVQRLFDAGKIVASESLLEEGTQFATEKYYEKVANNTTDKNFLTGIMGEYLDGLGTTEMQKSMFLGAVMGGIGGGVGAYRKADQEQKAAEGLRTILKDNFNGFSAKLTDLYLKEDVKDEAGVVTGQKYVLDEKTGLPKKDPVKVQDAFIRMLTTQSRSAMKDAAAAMGNKELFDFISNEEFTEFSLPYLQQEGGLEILNKHIDALSGKLMEDMKVVYGEDTTSTESEIRQNLKDKAAALQSIHDKAEIYGPIFSRLKYGKKDKELATRFMNDVKYGMINESSKQMFYQDKIEKLQEQSDKLSDSKLPADIDTKKSLDTQIETYKTDLETSINNFKALKDHSKQQSLFDLKVEEAKKLVEATTTEAEKFTVKSQYAKEFKDKVEAEAKEAMNPSHDHDTSIKKMNEFLTKLDTVHSKEQDDYITKYASSEMTATEAGLEFKKLKDNKFIDNIKEQVKARIKERTDAKANKVKEVHGIIKAYNRLFQLFQPEDKVNQIAFDQAFYDSLTPEQIANGLTLTVEDYTPKEEMSPVREFEGEKKWLPDYGIKVRNGFGIKKQIIAKVDGKVIGAFVDPDRFRFEQDGAWVEFDGSVEHLELLNPAFVTIDNGSKVPTKDGADFILHYTASKELMAQMLNQISAGKTEFTNAEVQNLFYITTTDNYDKTEPSSIIDYFTKDSKGSTMYTTNPDGTKGGIVVWERSAGIKGFYILNKVTGKFERIDDNRAPYYYKRFVDTNKLLDSTNDKRIKNHLIAFSETPLKDDKFLIKTIGLHHKVNDGSTTKEAVTFITDLFDSFINKFAENKANLKEFALDGMNTDEHGHLLFATNHNADNTNSGQGVKLTFRITGKTAGSNTTKPDLKFDLYSSGIGEKIELIQGKTGVKIIVIQKDGKSVLELYDPTAPKDKQFKLITSNAELVEAINKTIEARIQYEERRIKEDPNHKNAGEWKRRLQWLKDKNGENLKVIDIKDQVETNPDTLGDAQIKVAFNTTTFLRPQGRFTVKAGEDLKTKYKKQEETAINDTRVILEKINTDINGITDVVTLTQFRTHIIAEYAKLPDVVRANGNIQTLYNGAIANIDAKLKAVVNTTVTPAGAAFLASTAPGEATEAEKLAEATKVITTVGNPNQAAIDNLTERRNKLANTRVEIGKRQDLTPAERGKHINEISLEINTIDSQLRALTAINSDPKAPVAFKIASDLDNLEQVKYQDRINNLKKILSIGEPGSPITTHDWDVIMDNVVKGGVPLGKFLDSAIYLGKYGKGVEYHEAFHAVFRTFLSDVEILAVLKDAKKKYGEPSAKELSDLKSKSPNYEKLSPQQLKHLWYEEKMADAFQNKTEEPTSFLGKLFAKLRRFINWLTNNSSQVDNLFDDILAGRFKNKSKVENTYLKGTEAYSLLETENIQITTADGNLQYISGYLSAQVQKKVVSRIASEAFKIKESERDVSRLAIEDIINNLLYFQEGNKNTGYYSIDKYAIELDRQFGENPNRYARSFKAIMDVNKALQNPNNRNEIVNLVMERLNLYKFEIVDDNTESVEADSQGGIDWGIKAAYLTGGMTSSSKKMREYLSSIPVLEDEFGMDLKEEELEMLGMTSFADPYEVYISLEATLVNTPRHIMFKKLQTLAESNLGIRSFYHKLVNDMYDELKLDKVESMYNDIQELPISQLSKSDKFNLFISNFNKIRYSHLIIRHSVNGLMTAHRANMNDVQDTQVVKWSNNWTRKNLDNVANGARKTIETLSFAVMDEESIKPNMFNADLDSIRQKIASLGIDVSPMYVKWSLIANNLAAINYNMSQFPEQSETWKYYNDMLSFHELFNNAVPINSGLFSGMLESLRGGNPYGISGVNKVFAVDEVDEASMELARTGSLGRLKEIALSNSYFDESVGSSTFQNAEGETVYPILAPNYLSYEAMSLQDPARRHWIFEDSEEGRKKALKEVLLSYGKTFNDYQFEAYYQSVKNNPLFLGLNAVKDDKGKGTDNIVSSKEFSDMIFGQFSIYIHSGMELASLQSKTTPVDEEDEFSEANETIEKENFKASKGTSHNSLDKRGKMLTLLDYFADQTGNGLIKTKVAEGGFTMHGGRKVNNPMYTHKFAMFKTQQIEGKDTQYAFQLPIYDLFNSKGMTTLAKQLFFNSFKQEYDRIHKVRAEVFSGNFTPVEDYNNGEKRGFKFFNFDNLKEVDKELHDELIVNEDYFDTQAPNYSERKAKFDSTLEKMLMDEFQGFIDELKSSSVNIIQEVEVKDKDGNVTGTKLENYLLPNYYLQKTDDGKLVEGAGLDMNALGQFFFNDYINSLSMNNIMFGDLALNFKHNVDFVKRMAGPNASGPSAGYGTSNIAVKKDIKKDGINTTDAQSYGTPFWLKDKYLMAYGKSNKRVVEIYKKLVRGYKLSPQEIKVLEDNGALANPKKMTAFDTYHYLKCSVKFLLRSQVSYIEDDKITRHQLDNLYDKLEKLDRTSEAYKVTLANIHKLWKPVPYYADLHNMLNEMESKNIDMVFHESAVKTAKFNVTAEGEELQPQELSDTYIREQLSTDNMKSSIPHGSQLMQLITSEHPDLDAEVGINGKAYKVGELVDFYKKLLGSRVETSVEMARKALINNGVPNWKYILESFKKSLLESNSDFITMELFKPSSVNPNIPEYNPNLPRVETKFQAMFLKHVSKGLHQKVDGFKLTLVSDYGNNIMRRTDDDTIVSDVDFRYAPHKYVNPKTGEYRKDKLGNPLFKTDRLKYLPDAVNNTFEAECKISARLAEHFNVRVGDVLPKEFLEMMGVRIPTDDKHSMVSLKVVEFLPGETGNEIVMPYEILDYAGADFDIDSEFVRIFSSFKDSKTGENIFFGSYLKIADEEKRMARAFQEYISYITTNDIRVKQDIADRKSTDTEYEDLLKERTNLARLVQQSEKTFGKLSRRHAGIIAALANDDDAVIINDLYKATRPTTLDEENMEVHPLNDPFLKKEIKLDIAITLFENVKRAHKNSISVQELAAERVRIDTAIKNKELSYKENALNQFKSEYSTTLEDFIKEYGGRVNSNYNGKMVDSRPITIGEMNNHLLSMERVLVRNLHNNTIATTTTNVDLAKDFVKNYYTSDPKNPNKRTIKDPTVVKSVSSVVSKIQLDDANSTGKDNVAPSALFNIMFQYLKASNVTSRNNADSFSNFLSSTERDKNGNLVRVNAINTTEINMAVDSAKDQYPKYLNLSKQSIGAMLYASGIGKGFTFPGLINIQPEVKNLLDELIRNSSEIKTKGEQKRSKSSLTKATIEKLEGEITKLKVAGETSNAELSIANLEEALFFEQGNSKISKLDYYTIQLKAVQEFTKNKNSSSFLQNFTTLLGLVRGFDTSWAGTNDYKTSLKNLGLELYQLPNNKGSRISDFGIRHTEDYIKDTKKVNAYNEKNAEAIKSGEKSKLSYKYEFDLIEVFRKEPLLYAEIRAYAQVDNDSKHFFIVQTDAAKDTIDRLSLILQDTHLDYAENYNKLVRELIAFYNLKAYNHKFNRSYQIEATPGNNSALFASNTVNTKLMELYQKLAMDDYWSNNFFIQSLEPTKTDYTTDDWKDKSIFHGLVLRKLITGTRNKNKSPEFTRAMTENFNELFVGSDNASPQSNADAKAFVVEALTYLMTKDAGMFRNNSFIQYIEPQLMKNMINSLTDVQKVLSNPASTDVNFLTTFGMGKKELEKEFVELFGRYQTNKMGLKSNSLTNITKQILKAKSDPDVQAFQLGASDNLSPEEYKFLQSELSKADLEKIDPVWIDFNNGTLVVDVFRGTATADAVTKRAIRKSNVAGLLNTGLFKGVLATNTTTNSKFTAIAFPELIRIKTEDGDFLFKLRETRFSENAKAIDKTNYSIGSQAIYDKVDYIGTQEVMPYAFTTKQWKAFIELRKAKALVTAPVVTAAPILAPNEVQAAITVQNQTKSTLGNFLGLTQSGEAIPAVEVPTPIVQSNYTGGFDPFSTPITKATLGEFKKHPIYPLIDKDDRAMVEDILKMGMSEVMLIDMLTKEEISKLKQVKC